MISVSHHPARIVFYTYFVACKRNKLAQKQAALQLMTQAAKSSRAVYQGDITSTIITISVFDFLPRITQTLQAFNQSIKIFLLTHSAHLDLWAAKFGFVSCSLHLFLFAAPTQHFYNYSASIQKLRLFFRFLVPRAPWVMFLVSSGHENAWRRCASTNTSQISNCYWPTTLFHLKAEMQKVSQVSSYPRALMCLVSMISKFLLRKANSPDINIIQF